MQFNILSSRNLFRGLAFPCSTLALATLAACGGGGGSSSPSSLSISGTAATGAAMTGASIKVQCANGTSSTTSNSDGTYSVTVSGGALPCMLEASSNDGTATILHSVVESGAGTSVVANITPITELIVAQLLSNSSLATVFANFSSNTSAQQAITSSNRTAAIAQINSILAPIDSSITRIDPLKGSFKATTATVSGDATDLLIDKIVAKLAQVSPNTTTLNDRIQAVEKLVADKSAGIKAAKTLLTDPVANCPAARNVTYRIIGTGGGFGKTSSTDLTKGTFSSNWNDGTSETTTVSFSPTTACQFTATNSSSTLNGAFASSGMFIVRDPGSTNSTAGLGIGIPEQTIALADLAGTWNFLEYSYDSGSAAWQNYQSLITLDASGNVTSNQDCSGSGSSNSCRPKPDTNPPVKIVPNTDTTATAGGFNVINKDGAVDTSRLFAFRNTNGVLMLVAVSGQGGMMIGTPQRTLTVPAQGSISTFWDALLQYSNTSTPSSFNLAQITVQSVSGNSYTRIRNTVDGKADGRVDTFTVNQPRNGLRFRPSASYVLNGVTMRVSESVQMPIAGMGLNVTAGTGTTSSGKFIDFAVATP